MGAPATNTTLRVRENKMTINYIDGFDHYDAGTVQIATRAPSLWAQNFGNTTTGICKTAPAGMSGRALFHAWSYSIATNANEGSRLLLPVANANGIVFGCSYYIQLTDIPPSNGEYSIFALSDSSGVRDINIRLINGNGSLIAYRDAAFMGSLTGFEGNDRLVAGTTYLIEVKLTLRASDGDMEVRIDGDTVLNLIGDSDVISLATHMVFGHTILSPALVDTDGIFTKDLVIWDDQGSVNNNFIGDHSISTRLPDADTVQEDWTLTSGTDSFDLVNNIPPDGATNYLSTSVNTDRTDLDIADNPASTDLVLAVQQNAQMKNAGAGTSSVDIGLKSGSTDGVSSKSVTSSSSKYFSHILENDPDTSLPWTQDGVNLAKTVIKKTV